MIKTDLSGFVVTMHSGLCEQYVKSLGLSASGFDFLFRTLPCALWQQTPPEEPVLIPETKLVDYIILPNRGPWISVLILFCVLYCSPWI